MAAAGEHTTDKDAKKDINARAKVISRFLNDLTRIPVHVAMKGTLSFNEASELLCKKNTEKGGSGLSVLEEMIEAAKPKCEGNFTLMCTVHTFERKSIENIKIAPSFDEMVVASMTFKRFFNGKEIKKTND